MLNCGFSGQSIMLIFYALFAVALATPGTSTTTPSLQIRQDGWYLMIPLNWEGRSNRSTPATEPASARTTEAPESTQTTERTATTTLKQYHYKGCASKTMPPKSFAFTFDDGPTEYTLPLLAVLRKHNVKATFFTQGSFVTERCKDLRQTALEGHEIANHSWDHPKLAGRSEEFQRKQIEKTQEVITTCLETLDDPPVFFRAPFGWPDGTTFKLLREYPLRYVRWTLDPTDYNKHIGKDYIVNMVSNATERDIVLMHLTYQHTVDAVDEIIPKLKQRGFNFVTLSEGFQCDRA